MGCRYVPEAAPDLKVGRSHFTETNPACKSASLGTPYRELVLQ